MLFLTKNIVGIFVIKDNKIIDKHLFSENELIENYVSLKNNLETAEEKRLKEKYKDAFVINVNSSEKYKKMASNILSQYKERARQNNIFLTKHDLKNITPESILIIQTIDAIDEIIKSVNLLAKRIREWYGWYYPELSFKIDDNVLFLKSLTTKRKESMGVAFEKEDVEHIMDFAKVVLRLQIKKEDLEMYLTALMKKFSPNLLELAGATLAARLIKIAGSLKNLARFPSGTIQILGAEKAFFRFLRTGAKPPKYGIIYEHPFVQKAKNKGKAARKLANKLLLCAKLDFYKGEFIADKLKSQLEKEAV